MLCIDKTSELLDLLGHLFESVNVWLHFPAAFLEAERAAVITRTGRPGAPVVWHSATEGEEDSEWGTLINSLHAEFLTENINIYIHFVSYLHIDTTQVVEILPQIRQEPAYST